MEDWICVSSFYYDSAFRIRKYMNAIKMPYKMDCNCHPDDGFQLLIPQDYKYQVERIRNQLSNLTTLTKDALLAIPLFAPIKN